MFRSAPSLEVPVIAGLPDESEAMASLFDDTTTRTNAYLKTMNEIAEAFHNPNFQEWEEYVLGAFDTLMKYLNSAPPSFSVLQIMTQILLRTDQSMRSSEAVTGLITELRDKIGEMMEQKQIPDKNKPPIIPEVPYSNFYLKILNSGKEDDDFNTTNTTQMISKQSRPMTARYHRQGKNNRDPHALLGFVEDIWMQVDPVGNRIVVRSTGHEDTIEEILTSITAGAFVIFKNELSWVGTNRMTSDQETGVVLKFNDITKYTWGRIGRSPSYYLSIHAGEVFKFFPFSEHEIKEVVIAMEDLSGKEPYEEKAFIQQLLTLKLEATQNQVLRELAKMPNPWIDHTDYLYEVIDNLTSEGKPQSIFDMERLFHSCRLNEEVTKETLTSLRRNWDDATNEVVRVKILTIIDRLMDRAVMRMSDSNFTNLSAWLKEQEKALDPYKSSQSLAMLEKIRHKEENIKMLGIAPVAQHQFREQFDMLDEFRTYQKQYAMNEEDLF